MRSDVYLTSKCDFNCIFCQLYPRDMQDVPTSEILREFTDAKKSGMTIANLSGREPALHTDILKIINHLSQTLQVRDIWLQTNCRRLSNKDFAREIIKAGITFVATSFQAHNSELCDMLLRTKQSFNQIIAGIRNVIELGKPYITNTVINTYNYMYLKDIAEALHKNFDRPPQLTVFTFCEPRGFGKDNFLEVTPRIAEVIPHLHEALEFCLEHKMKVQIQAVPQCLLGKKYAYLARDVDTHLRLFHRNPDEEYKVETFRNILGDINYKDPGCEKCIYETKCEGLWGHYGRVYGTSELKPVINMEDEDNKKL